MTMPRVNNQEGTNDHGNFPDSTANVDEALQTEDTLSLSLIDKENSVKKVTYLEKDLKKVRTFCQSNSVS